MKRDQQLLLAILERIEDHSGNSEPDMTFAGYSDETVHHHLDLLISQGLIDAIDCSTLTSVQYLISRLTWKGHDYLSNSESSPLQRADWLTELPHVRGTIFLLSVPWNTICSDMQSNPDWECRVGRIPPPGSYGLAWHGGTISQEFIGPVPDSRQTHISWWSVEQGYGTIPGIRVTATDIEKAQCKLFVELLDIEHFVNEKQAGVTDTILHTLMPFVLARYDCIVGHIIEEWPSKSLGEIKRNALEFVTGTSRFTAELEDICTDDGTASHIALESRPAKKYGPRDNTILSLQELLASRDRQLKKIEPATSRRVALQKIGIDPKTVKIIAPDLWLNWYDTDYSVTWDELLESIAEDREL